METLWLLIRTAPAKEPTATHILKGRGFEAYSPMRLVWRRIVRHHRAREREGRLIALFPSYVFVGLNGTTPDAIALREMPCVMGFVSVDGKSPYPISSIIIEDMRHRFGEITTGPELLRWSQARPVAIGDTVRLIEAALILRGQSFKVEAIRGKAAVIFAQLFGGITVTTPVDNLEAIEHACGW
jgi:transcription antitermination factor NusG